MQKSLLYTYEIGNFTGFLVQEKDNMLHKKTVISKSEFFNRNLLSANLIKIIFLATLSFPSHL
jgi:hypothetical protein